MAKLASIIDYKKKRLSPTVWDNESLRPQIKSFIMGFIKQYFPSAQDAFILGSITTLRYTNRSDIDINITVHRDDLDEAKETAKNLTEEHLRYPGCPHPLGFYVSPPGNKQGVVEGTIGAYSLVDNKWIKKPDEVGTSPVPLEGEFKKHVRNIDAHMGELNRDMTDIKLMIESFGELDETTQKQVIQDVESKKAEIDDDIKLLTQDYDALHKAREEAFATELESDPAAAKKYMHKQLLPGNVIYKIMERYGYRGLLENLVSIYDDMHPELVEQRRALYAKNHPKV